MDGQKLNRNFGAGSQLQRRNLGQGADSFVQKAPRDSSQGNALLTLANAFKVGQEGLAQQTAYISEEAKKEAIKAHSQYGKEIGKASREGKIKYFENPVFQSTLSNLKGKQAGIAYNQALRTAYTELPNKHQLQPDEFIQFEQDFRQQFIADHQGVENEEGSKSSWDDDFITSFAGSANQYVNNLGQSHAALQQEALKEEHSQLIYSQTLATLQEGVLEKLDDPDAVIDVQSTVASLNKMIDDSYNSGMQGRDVSDSVVGAILSLAKEHDNGAIAEIAYGLKQGNSNMFDQAGNRDKLVAAIKQGEEFKKNQQDRKDREIQKARAERQRVAMTTVGARLYANPDDPLDDIYQANPDLFSEITRMRNTAQKDPKTDTNTIINLQDQFRAGTLTHEKVTQAFAEGKLSKSDWDSLSKRIDANNAARDKSRNAAQGEFDKARNALSSDFGKLVENTLKPNTEYYEEDTIPAVIAQFQDNFDQMLDTAINNGQITDQLSLNKVANEIQATLMERHESLKRAKDTSREFTLDTFIEHDKAAAKVQRIQDISKNKEFSPSTTEKAQTWANVPLLIDSPERELDIIQAYQETQGTDIPLRLDVSNMFSDYGIDPRNPEELKAFLITQRILREEGGNKSE